MRHGIRRWWVGTAARTLALCASLASSSFAQDLEPLTPAKPAGSVTASLVASVTAIVPGQPFDIGVKLKISKGYYTYYKAPGSIGLPTKVTFAGPEGFEVGQPEFPGPEIKYVDIERVVDVNYIYKHDTIILAQVTPPANFAAGGTSEFSAKVSFQYCAEDGACYPPKPTTLTLRLPMAKAGTVAEASADAAAFRRTRENLPVPGDKSKYAKVSASLRPPTLAPGGKAELVVAVDVEPGLKLQMNRPTVAGLISTDLVVDRPAGIKPLPLPIYPAPKRPEKPAPGFENALEYRGKFEIRVPIAATERLKGEDIQFSGLLRYQACNAEGSCFPPQYASFEVAAPVSAAIAAGDGADDTGAVAHTGDVADEAPIASAPVVADANRPSLANLELVISDENDGRTLADYLLLAFAGGLILNVMPCVLPVLAIKVLSFVRQAGESRTHIFLLNVCYAAGVISVFLALATLAVMAGFTWGGLFQLPEFNLVMAGLVFSMGLSLLGVFEIPVPGFVGSASGAGRQEGPAGAFLTGIFATLLATPCSGPFLGVTLGWSVRQPPPVTYAVWATMGLGMASPYLVIGLFPGAVKWLPKPGNWMVAFKEVSGLVLMGTVVFIVSSMDLDYTIPVLVILVGLAVAFWMIGNLYGLNSKRSTKRVVRSLAALVAVSTSVFALTTVKEGVQEQQRLRIEGKVADILRERGTSGGLARSPAADDKSRLPWQPFSEALLEELIAKRQTVLIDFTANWCLTCKRNEAFALNTAETRALVDKLGVATLYADFTQESPEVRKWLDKFQSISVPLTVIFPAEDPSRPIVLRDVYSQLTLLASLERAGRSASDGPAQANLSPPHAASAAR